MNEPTLFDRDRSIERRFREFDAANPHVYAALVSLARQVKAAGKRHVGIAVLWERMRFDLWLSTTGGEFKLDNSFRSRYARAIMDNEADLADFFFVRRLRAA